MVVTASATVGGASTDENECVEASRDILILIAEIGEMARAGYRGRTRTMTSGIASSLQSTRLVPVTSLHVGTVLTTSCERSEHLSANIRA